MGLGTRQLLDQFGRGGAGDVAADGEQLRIIGDDGLAALDR
jgi:hypothetical protein